MPAGQVKLDVTNNSDRMTMIIERAPDPYVAWTVIFTINNFDPGVRTVFNSPGSGSWKYRAKARDAAWPVTDSTYALSGVVVIP
jgi:hypothetical protein